MTTAKALKMQIDLANTAHQREVADLQAAGLNPILSANGSGAAVPNLSGFATSSGSKTSARAAIKLAKLDPTAKAIDTANNAVDQIAAVAKKMSPSKTYEEMHPERVEAANEAVERNHNNLVNLFAQSLNNTNPEDPNTLIPENYNSARQFIEDARKNGWTAAEARAAWAATHAPIRTSAKKFMRFMADVGSYIPQLKGYTRIVRAFSNMM